MRLIHAYLIVYFGLIAGAILTLWQAHVLAQVAPMKTACGVLIAIGLGVALGLLTRRNAK